MRTHLLEVIAALAGVTLAADAALANSSIRLELAGTFKTGVFDRGAAEIPAYDCATKQVFVVNGDSEAIDILDLSDPTNPVKVGALSIQGYGSPNSLATLSNSNSVGAIHLADISVLSNLGNCSRPNR